MPYVQAFDTHADRYDAWYEDVPGRDIFAMEVACLRPLLSTYRQPYLEVGVGSGRFAQALGIAHGIDPAPELLKLALGRGIGAVRGVGERLPFPEETFGGVLIAFTLCFVSRPAAVLEEAFRVLRPGGGLVLGLVPRESPWGQHYAAEAQRGHPLYRHARFLSWRQVEGLLRRTGFTPVAYRSTLLAPPGQDQYRTEGCLPGHHKGAGFIGVEARC